MLEAVALAWAATLEASALGTLLGRAEVAVAAVLLAMFSPSMEVLSCVVFRVLAFGFFWWVRVGYEGRESLR